VGQSYGAEAGEVKGDVPRSVALEGAAGVVEGEGVQFDDETGVAEVGVDLVAVDDDVELGAREVMVAAEVADRVRGASSARAMRERMVGRPWWPGVRAIVALILVRSSRRRRSASSQARVTIRGGATAARSRSVRGTEVTEMP